MRWILCCLLCLLFVQPVLAHASAINHDAGQQLTLLTPSAEADLLGSADEPDHGLLSQPPTLANLHFYPPGVIFSHRAGSRNISHGFARGPPNVFLA